MNNITIAGNIGKNPELKYSGNNLAILKFSVADTSGKDDNKKTTWHDIVVFGEQAENVAEKAGQGTRVVVVGRPVDRAAKALHATVIQDDEPPF
jgi:single-strand DNA-binding protein